MRALIDAQLPPGLCGWLRERGVEAAHVADVLDGQASDAAIASHAAASGLVLTKDDDFRLRPRPANIASSGCAAATSPTAPCVFG